MPVPPVPEGVAAPSKIGPSCRWPLKPRSQSESVQIPHTAPSSRTCPSNEPASLVMSSRPSASRSPESSWEAPVASTTVPVARPSALTVSCQVPPSSRVPA